MDLDGEIQGHVNEAGRLYGLHRPADAFLAILRAVRLDPCAVRLQNTALKLTSGAHDEVFSRYVEHWLAASGFGNLENAAAILTGCVMDGDDDDESYGYPLFCNLSIVALRLEKPALSIELFGHCLTASLPLELAAGVVEGSYDDLAVGYDDGYLHEISVTSFMDFIGRNLPRTAPLDIIDAPCGTGLAGAALRPWARRLVGSDLSPAMAARARLCGCYDEMLVGDLTETLPCRSADLLVSHGSLYYFRDLGPIAAAAAACLRPGGHFAFDDYPAPRGVMVTNGGNRRYCRGAEVVRADMAAHGFTEVTSRLAQTFGLPCVYWLFRKAAA